MGKMNLKNPIKLTKNSNKKGEEKAQGKAEGHSLLDSRNATMLLSLVLAILVWVIVTVFILQNTSSVISDVPVNFKYDSSKYTGLGLEIVNQPEHTVRLEVTGKGYEVGNLNKTDFIVYPDYSSIKGAGAMDLKLKVRLADSQLSSSVQATVDSRDATVSVVFDAVVEKHLPVVAEYENLRLAEGYTLNKVLPAPAEVTIRGPQSEVDQVAKAVIHLDVGEELRDSRLLQAKVQLMNDQGNIITPQYTVLDNDIVDVTISVYQTAELPLKVQFTGVPANFDVSCLGYSLSPQTIKVAGPAKDLSNLTELTVAAFDLTTFETGKDYQLPLNLPKNITATENMPQVTLSFDTSGLAVKTLNIPGKNIQPINLPSNYQLTVETDRLYNVTLVGPAEEMKTLSANNVIAQIDAENFQVTAGRDNVPVEIIVPSSNHIFAAGNYTAQCNITTK